MTEQVLLLVQLSLLGILLTTGIILRVIAGIVHYHATRRGSPHLSTGVFIMGMCLLGLGLSLGTIAGLYANSQTFQPSEAPTIGMAGTLAAFLLICGLTLWGCGRVIRADAQLTPGERISYRRRSWLYQLALLFGNYGRIETVIRHIVRLSWCAALLSVAFCLLPTNRPELILALVPLELACLTLLIVVEGLLWWNNRGHRQMLKLWQIHLAVESHRPLADELDFLSDYSWGNDRQRLLEASEDLKEGDDADATILKTLAFSKLDTAQVATGMKAGRLPQVLRGLLARRNAFFSDVHDLQDQVSSVLYFWVVILTLIDIVAFIMYWIIPKFKKIFDDFGTELPTITTRMIHFSDLFVNYWYLCLPSIMVMMVGLSIVNQFPFIKVFPWLRLWTSRIWPRVCLPDLLRSLAVAIEARVPLEEALTPFLPLYHRLIRVREQIREGNDLWIELAEERFLSRSEASLLRSAQKADNLPWALETVCRQFEQSWFYRTKVCLEFLQPLVLLVIALFIGIFVAAFFLPLVKLINDLA